MFKIINSINYFIVTKNIITFIYILKKLKYKLYYLLFQLILFINKITILTYKNNRIRSRLTNTKQDLYFWYIYCILNILYVNAIMNV